MYIDRERTKGNDRILIDIESKDLAMEREKE